MVNSPKTEVMEGGAKLARALNDKGVEVTFGKRSEGNDDLSTVIDMAANQINSSSGGSVNIVTEWESTLSDSKVPSEKLVKNSLDDKISKLQTNGLIKNDGTINISLNKLSTIIDELKSLGLDLFNYNDTYDLLVYLFYDKLQYNTYDEKVSYTKNGSTYYELATIHDIPDVSTKADKSGGASQITDPNAHSNLGTSANATQSQINTAIDSMIGQAIQYITQ